MGFSPEDQLIIKIQRAPGRKTSRRGDLYGDGFSKIQIAKCLPVLFMQVYQDSALSPGLSSYALRNPPPRQLPFPSCPQTPR